MSRGVRAARAAELGWTVHRRIEGAEPPSPPRAELLGEAFALLAELDARSLEAWVAALRSPVSSGGPSGGA